MHVWKTSRMTLSLSLFKHGMFNMQSSGYTCFHSSIERVEIIADLVIVCIDLMASVRQRVRCLPAECNDFAYHPINRSINRSFSGLLERLDGAHTAVHADSSRKTILWPITSCKTICIISCTFSLLRRVVSWEPGVLYQVIYYVVVLVAPGCRLRRLPL